MADILAQIKEDIEFYQTNYPHISKMKNKDWAFNFWILDRFYSIDDQFIENYIIDYRDMGIDCYVWHEETLDLYLIQNKYFSTSKLDASYVSDHFLIRPVGALKGGNYTHCPELQTIFDKYKNESDFTVHLQLYVTETPTHPEKIESLINDFNTKDIHYEAHVYWLKDIENLFFGEPIEEKKKMDFTIKSLAKTSIMSVKTKAWDLPLEIDVNYVFEPILNLYELCKKAEDTEYKLFDENIRDYLGIKRVPVNKGIRDTLLDENDRKNFFYYNNGITMIVEDMGKIESGKFVITNPKIVNGCQSVSTIYETISSQPVSTIDSFKDTYVMLKVLKIPSDNAKYKKLKDNIVKYNNSQNGINQKTFAALRGEFNRLQDEFLNKGIIVCIKQSDEYQFKKEYKTASKLLERNLQYLDLFSIKNHAFKALTYKLEKVLQVFIAFDMGFYNAVQKKGKILDVGQPQNTRALEFIRNNSTTNDKFSLFLLYLRAEQEKRESIEGIYPIPMMLIEMFAKYQCDRDPTKISEHLQSKENIDNIMAFYSVVISQYFDYWKEANPGKGYNDLLKNEIDWVLMDKARNLMMMGPYRKFAPQ